MRHITLALSAAALVIVGFGAGYLYRAAHISASAEMGDYAVSNILEDVGYESYLSKRDTNETRELLDVYLNNHLSRLREHQGAIEDEGFVRRRYGR